MSDRLAQFLGPELLKMVSDGQKLLNLNSNDFYDYSFALFPVAKAYEGYLKKLFFSLGAISQNQYESDHWRVGKALNPQLEKEIRHEESVYDRIVEKCGSPDPHSSPETTGQKQADMFWESWRKGRNQVFHYFPSHYRPLSALQAKEISDEILLAMEDGLVSCHPS